MSNQGGGSVPERDKTFSSEWWYQEIKDWKKVSALQHMAKQQAAIAEAAQRGADAQMELAALERERLRLEAEKAGRLVNIEQHKLQIEIDRQQKEQQKQNLKANLFSLQQGLGTISHLGADPLTAYLMHFMLLQRLQAMPVKEVGDYEDMTFHAKLMSLVQQGAAAAEQQAPGDVEAFREVVAECHSVGEAALALDSFWQASRMTPLRNMTDKLRQELAGLESQRRIGVGGAKGSRLMTAAFIGFVALGILALLVGVIVAAFGGNAK